MKLREFIKAREKRLAIAERQLVRKLLNAFNETLHPIYEAAKTGQLQGLEGNLVLSDRYIKSALKWIYVDWSVKFGRWFLRNHEIKQYDYFQQTLESIFDTEAAEMVRPIMGVTLERAKPAIREALKLANEGKAIDDITAAIRAKVTGEGGAMSVGRARTIARTEVISASNQSSYESVKTTGIELEKKWITGGVNIRDTHIAAQGQGWIRRDEKFRVGPYMAEHPGDNSLGVEERANCKCVLIYRTI